MQELRRLDLNLLKALSVLLDEQNVSRAANTGCHQRRGQSRCTNR